MLSSVRFLATFLATQNDCSRIRLQLNLMDDDDDDDNDDADDDDDDDDDDNDDDDDDDYSPGSGLYIWLRLDRRHAGPSTEQR